MKKIRALIIDDEPAARMELVRMLKNYPQVTLLAEAGDVDQAESLIKLLKPDLLFLDIQMPDASGFELLERLEQLPQVIFVTAFDRYALQAFEVSALDYLMKPVREERFAKAIHQVIEKINYGYEPSVFIKDRGRHHLIKWKDVHLIESVENYARIHFGNEHVLLKTSLNKLVKNPDCAHFFRAGRAQLFNLNYVKEIGTDKEGMWVKLTTDELIRLSERQASKFRNINK
ncbi:response regulator transcription factor [Pedobacter sp. Du54]|uniref:LytR/AlgR family response regulator transcription factor n=1 Tax=Pedobacter anseongensis TaxID=3133439 RepID=UPI0030A452FE